MRELKINEFEDVNGGWVWFAVAGAVAIAGAMAGDAARDNHAMNKANDICGDAGVASVDTNGLTGVTITCQPGG